MKDIGANAKNLEMIERPDEIPENKFIFLLRRNMNRMKKKSETESKIELLANKIVHDEIPAKIRLIIGFPPILRVNL